MTFLKWFRNMSTQMMVRVVLASQKANLCRFLIMFFFFFYFHHLSLHLRAVSTIHQSLVQYSTCLPMKLWNVIYEMYCPILHYLILPRDCNWIVYILRRLFICYLMQFIWITVQPALYQKIWLLKYILTRLINNGKENTDPHFYVESPITWFPAFFVDNYSNLIRLWSSCEHRLNEWKVVMTSLACECVDFEWIRFHLSSW